MWLCRCDCGNLKVIHSSALKAGLTRSCGCFHDEYYRKHGHNGLKGQSPTYKSWDNMISRCTRPSHGSYPAYGGSGITVCHRWCTFANFLADMGERPSLHHSIDRINGSKGYEPGNCRWATRIEQARNSCKVKPVIRSDGKRYDTIIDAASDTCVDYTCIVKACRGQRKSAGGYNWYYLRTERQ
jgi:hypothetical protein